MSQNQTSGYLPFFVAVLAYTILHNFSRIQLGQLGWSIAALLVIPALAALTVRAGSRGYRQRIAFWTVLWAAVFYTAINLLQIRGKIGSGETGGILLASLLSCVVYGSIAGGVAALVVRLRLPKGTS